MNCSKRVYALLLGALLLSATVTGARAVPSVSLIAYDAGWYGAYGLMDETGARITPPDYSAAPSPAYYDAVDPAQAGFGAPARYIAQLPGGGNTVLDEQGREIVQRNVYRYILACPERRFLGHRAGGGYDLLDDQGKLVLTFDKEYRSVSAGLAGQFIAETDKGYILLGADAKPLTAAYRSLFPGPYPSSAYIIQKDGSGRRGALGTDGAELIPIKYRTAVYYNGLCIVRNDSDEYFLINREEKALIPPKKGQFISFTRYRGRDVVSVYHLDEGGNPTGGMLYDFQMRKLVEAPYTHLIVRGPEKDETIIDVQQTKSVYAGAAATAATVNIAVSPDGNALPVYGSLIQPLGAGIYLAEDHTSQASNARLVDEKGTVLAHAAGIEPLIDGYVRFQNGDGQGITTWGLMTDKGEVLLEPAYRDVSAEPGPNPERICLITTTDTFIYDPVTGTTLLMRTQRSVLPD